MVIAETRKLIWGKRLLEGGGETKYETRQYGVSWG